MKIIKTSLFLLFFFYSFSNLSAQSISNGKIDSVSIPLDTLMAKKNLITAKKLIKVKRYTAALVKAKAAESILTKGKAGDDLAETFFSLGVIYTHLKNLPQGFNYFNQALKLHSSQNPKKEIPLANIHYQIGRIFLLYNRLPQAQSHFDLSLKYFESDPSHPNLPKVQHNIGVIEWNNGKFMAAKQRFKQCYELWINSPNPDSVMIANSLNNMGLIYREEGQLRKSMEYHLRALEIRQSVLPSNHEHIVASLVNIGLINADINRFGEALQYYYKALVNVKKDGTQQAVLYSNMAQVFSFMGDYEQSLYYRKKAQTIEKSKLPENHPTHALTCYNLGWDYLNLKNYDIAEQTFKEGLTTPILKPKDKANLYFGLGQVYTSKGNYQKALGVYQQALTIRNQLEQNQLFRKNDIHVGMATTYRKLGNLDEAQESLVSAEKSLNPLLGKITKERNCRNSSYALWAEKIAIYMAKYRKNNDLSDLKLAAKVTDEVYFYLNDFQNNSLEFISTQGTTDLSFNFFEQSMFIYHLLYQATGNFEYQEQFFRNLEKSKATRFRKIIYHSEISQQIDAAKQFLVKMQPIKNRIMELEKEQFEKSSDGKNHQNIAEPNKFSEKIAALKVTRDSLWLTFNWSSPDLQKFQFDNKVIELKQARETLTTNQAFIEFFIGEKTIFLTVISKENFQIVPIKRDFPLSDWVNKLRSDMLAPFLGNQILGTKEELSHQKQYSKTAFQIYERVLLPAEDYLQGITELIIIPDGILHQLPFDALLTKPIINTESKSFKNYPYLIHKYQTSFAFSVTLHQVMSQPQLPPLPNKLFAGFAPIFSKPLTNVPAESNAYLPPLYDNINEVKAIQGIMGGDLYIETKATKSIFNAVAANYRILHFSTHALGNVSFGDYAPIVFYPETKSTDDFWLYNRELSVLKIKPDMVVMSACETNVGEFQLGEGNINLTRGFALAGAKSIVSSSWKIKELPTKQLFIKFYEDIRAGLPRNTALRNAKIDLLNNSQFSTPYYWAGFTLTGDTSPIKN